MTRSKWIVAGVALALMALSAALLFRLKAVQRLGPPGVKVVALPGSERLEIELPARVRQYASTNVAPTELELSTLPQDTTFGRRLYLSPSGFQLLLSVVMMGTDRTSIHKPEFCLTSQGWQITHQETTALPIEYPHPYELPVRKFYASMAAQGPGGQVTRWSGVYVFWFVADQHLTASHLSRVATITWDLLRTGVLPRWAYVSCFATCPPGQEQVVYERMAQFLAAAVPEFQLVTLPSAGGSPPPPSTPPEPQP
ncbi:MAG: exosortase-associated EpsI family protein [Verrucomicrobia bacterium]|nr:exosortase-associated EpsI family protein [Verrucomicrobiota bacterium]